MNKKEQKKIIVTGGCGFIGSSVIKKLLSETNHIVLNIDKLTYASNPKALDSYLDDKRYFFCEVDICNFDKIQEIILDFEPNLIMHLAAESHVDKSILRPVDFINTNILGTYNLLESSRQLYLKSNLKKENFLFHHISTDEVFGDLPHPNDQNISPYNLPKFKETSSYKPSSPYSASKASADHLVRAWRRTYGLPSIITNCSNNYGPYQFPEKLIPMTIINAYLGKSIKVYGDGSQIRDWLYVEDHAQALLDILFNNNLQEDFNIGGSSEKSNLDVVNEICSIMDSLISEKPNNISSFKSLIKFVSDRPGHDKRYAIDSSKVRNAIGWTPNETFESGIKKTVSWYINNKDWWIPITKKN